MRSPLLLAHIVSVAVFFGATAFVAILIPTLGRGTSDPSVRRDRYAAVLRVFSPLVIGALGVIVMTGAWSITGYKQSLGQDFGAIGSGLILKLGMAFLVIMFATQLTFGIAHRLVRASMGALPVTDADLDKTVRRLTTSAWITLALTTYTIWVALGPGA